ncbi:unnamed protein product [Calypogeia fissa]
MDSKHKQRFKEWEQELDARFNAIARDAYRRAQKHDWLEEHTIDSPNDDDMDMDCNLAGITGQQLMPLREKAEEPDASDDDSSEEYKDEDKEYEKVSYDGLFLAAMERTWSGLYLFDLKLLD